MTQSDTFSHIFQEVLSNINTHGEISQPRDLKVKELILTTIPLDPIAPFVNTSTREFNWKYFAGELAWYLKKDTNVDYINNFSKFWSNLTNPGTDEINSNYGALLFGEQLEWVVKSLREDSRTRQAVAFLNQPKYQFEGNKDFVCTMYLNFFIRNNQLHMKVQMRSNDIFYGLTFDAPFFALVHQHVYLWIKDKYPLLEIGDYIHCSDNTHYYEKHFSTADKIISEDLSKVEHYTMNISTPLFIINNGNMILTESGNNLIREIDNSIKNDLSQEDYRNLLSKYLNIGVLRHQMIPTVNV